MDAAELVPLAARHADPDDSFSFSDALQLMSATDQDRFWLALCDLAHDKVTAAFSEQEADDDNEDMETTLVDFFESVCTLALSALCIEPLHWSQPVGAVVNLLHDILFMLSEEHEGLREAILRICELCWKLDVEGKESLVPNSVSLLLIRSVGQKSTGALVKRVYAFRTAFHLLDLDDAEDLRSLLLSCVVHSTYLKVVEGRKFLAFLLGLNVPFIDNVYAAIRRNLPGATKATCTAYGEIIFRAWKNADGAIAQKLEQSVIQDVMYRAVHAARPPTGLSCAKGIASSLRHLLGYIHSQKRQRGVDEMLARLYQPILWRSLKVANALVRANAAALLFDAFPIHNPDSSRTDIDETLQMQFDAVTALLHDTEPTVRVLAVHGVCRIVNTFWEMIPVATVSSMFELLVNELSQDVTSPNVRQAVCEGMRYMLDNPLAVPLMQSILPHMANLLYDTAERVRCAFVDLLIAVKDLRAIKFWKIVPLEQLVHRLDEDRDQVARRLSALLLKSFFPSDKTDAAVIERCTTLIETNPRAARKFFIHLRKFATADAILKFAFALAEHLLDAVDSEAQNDDAHDHYMICAMLDVLAICVEWTVKQNTEPHRDMILDMIRSVDALVLNLAGDAMCHKSAAAIASQLAASQTPALAMQYLSTLCKMDGEKPDLLEIRAMTECICIHNKAGKLMSILCNSLQTYLAQGSNKKTKPAHSSAAGRDLVMPPMVAMHVCMHLMAHSLCRSALLDADSNGRQQLANVLSDVIPALLSHMDDQGIMVSDSHLLKDILAVYSRLALVIKTHDDESHHLDKLCAFAVRQVLPAWLNSASQTSAHDNSELQAEVTEYLRVLLCTLTEALVVGVVDDEAITENVQMLCAAILKSGHGWALAPLLCKALYQLYANGVDDSAMCGQLVSFACQRPDREWTRQDTEMLKGFAKTLFHNAHLCGQDQVINTVVEMCIRPLSISDNEEHPAVLSIGEVLGALSLGDMAMKPLQSLLATQGENTLDAAVVCNALSLLKGAKVQPDIEAQTSLQRLAEHDVSGRLTAYTSDVSVS